jgi:hypothetical protein
MPKVSPDTQSVKRRGRISDRAWWRRIIETLGYVPTRQVFVSKPGGGTRLLKPLRTRQPKPVPVARKVIPRSAPRGRRCPRRSLGARAGPSDGDGGGDPAAALERFQKTRAWAALPWADRHVVIRLLASGDPAAAKHIDQLFASTAIACGQCPDPGELWLGPGIPTNALLTREPSGLWRSLQFGDDSEAPWAWQTRGRA